MKKIHVMILIVVSALVLTACEPEGPNNNGGNLRSWIGGTQGIDISYEIDAPPDTVTVGDSFNVLVTLKNEGEHTVEAGEYFVKLNGIRAENFGVSFSDLQVEPDEDLIANELDPTTGDVLESYEIYVEVPENADLAYDENAGITSNSFPFLTEICYKYTTYANALLCIKENLADTQDTDVCIVSGPQAISSSGAPVQITDFKESRGGKDSVRFSFNIIATNTGGQVSRLDSACGSHTLEENYVFVTVDTGMSSTKCNGFSESVSDTEGFVKLSDGSKQIYCTQPIDKEDLGDYVSVVEITAEYDYQMSTYKDVFVQKQI